jgi:hypothetical protein
MRCSSVVIGFALLACLWLGLPTDGADVAAGTAIRMDVPELVQHADQILEGRVLAARAEEVGARIETEVLVQVERAFAGDARPYQVLRLPGGVLDDGRGMCLAGMPRLVEGEDVLLFLSQAGSTGLRVPCGLAQGKLLVAEDATGCKVLVRDPAGLALVDALGVRPVVESAWTVLDYAQTVAQIEAALAAKGAK